MKLLINAFFLSFQIAALIAAIWYRKQYKHTTERYFLAFLIYVVCHEIVGLCITHFLIKDGNVFYNDIIYNVYTMVSFSFYFFWFYKILETRRFLIPVVFSVFLLFFLYDLFDKDPFYYLYLNPIIAGAFCILVLTISYFVELLRADTITNFVKSQKFWIVTGLFCFYIGLIPLLVFHSMLDYGGHFYSIVITVLNAILYGCIFKSFLCLRKTR
ncbi:MAG: hypothetical protein AAF611_19435 [Bacteroidota bacterium]